MVDLISSDSSSARVHSTSRLVTLVGVYDLIVVQSVDAVLVANRSQSQDVKHIVKTLCDQAPEEQTLHHKVHRLGLVRQ
jgi:mannose-1-phosphate guanylyltransferase/mannose-6-phosphate isomerase